jgi:hypothetical protein
LGVRSWIVCRSRLAFLRLTRDWLGELMNLGRDDEHVDGFLEDSRDALRTIGDGLGRLAPVLDGVPKPAAKRKAKSATTRDRGAEAFVAGAVTYLLAGIACFFFGFGGSRVAVF